MHRYRANLCRGLDETAEAEKSYTDAMGHYSTLAQKYPEDKRFKQSQAEIARDFAMLLKRIGRLNKASSLLQDSVREYEKLQHAESSSTDIQRVQANILIDQADLEYELGRFVDSERTARKAIAIYVRLIDTPRSHPDVLEPLFQSMAENRLAMCLREQGRIDEALVAHSEAVGRSMTLIKTNPSRDFLAFSYRNRAERAYTLSRIPDQRQTAWDEFSESIAGCAKLSKQFPDFSFYRHGQAFNPCEFDPSTQPRFTGIQNVDEFLQLIFPEQMDHALQLTGDMQDGFSCFHIWVHETRVGARGLHFQCPGTVFRRT
jgi:tetratricopeptide (TPR) repeat protein